MAKSPFNFQLTLNDWINNSKGLFTNKLYLSIPLKEIHKIPMREHIIRRESYWKLGEFMKMKMLITTAVFLCLNNAIQAADLYGCNDAENFTKEKFNEKRYDECKAQADKAKREYDSCIAKHTQTILTETEVVNAGQRVKTNSPSSVINDSACTSQQEAVQELSSFRSFSAAKDAELTGENIRKEDGKIGCEKIRKEREAAAKEYISTENNENQDGSTGSLLMRECVKISGNNMRYLYGQQRKKIEWEILLNASKECISADPACAEGNESVNAKACENLKRTAARCDAAAFIINEYGRDWRSPEHVKPSEVKGGNPEIKCTSQGIETLDYEGCVKFVQNGDIMDAAQGAIQQGQDLYYQDKAMTAQMEVANSKETATAGLKALETGVKGQEDIMTQRAALNTGKFAALVTYYSEIPSIDDVKDKCKNYSPVQGLPAGGCDSAIQQHPGFAFLMNTQAKEKMKAKLAKVGIDVASNVMMAALMAKRGKDIKNAIAKVDEFKPIDPLAPPADDLQSTYCQQNPGDAKCLTGGLDRTFDAMSDNVINFGEGGTGTSYNNTNPFTDPTAGTKDSASSGNKKGLASVGGVISSAQQNGGLESKAAAATVTKGAAPSAGGGGGGSGGGVGGGGGGGVPGAQPQGGTSAAIQGKTPSYGGGSGTLSMMGGFGINKKNGAPKDDSNPFGKLFNKDGNKSAVVNFQDRSPASVGSKGDNIFNMISKRYTTVSSDKRLLEYELTK